MTEEAKASVDSGFASKLAPCLVKYKDDTDSNKLYSKILCESILRKSSKKIIAALVRIAFT